MKALNPSQKESVNRLFNAAVKARMEVHGRPFLLLHLITNRCICKCQSCLWKNNDWKDLPLDDLKGFYAQADQEGIVATVLSGGEPFMRKDLGELARFIKEETEINTVLFNTGWYLKERMDEVLPHIDMMLMSIDSARPERHDQIRGLTGLYDRLMEGIELVGRKYPDVALRLNCCIQKGIAEEIDDLLKLAESLDLRISFDVITEYRHGENGTVSSQTDMGMPLAELREVCRYLLEKKQEGAPILNSELYFQYFADGKKGYRCHFPKICMMVDGRGNIEHCLNLDKPIANLRDMPLKEIMELPRFKDLRVEAEDCCSCNSPTMVDTSCAWENPQILMEKGGIDFG